MDAEVQTSEPPGVMDAALVLGQPCRCPYPSRYGWSTGTVFVVWASFCCNCGGHFYGR